MKGKKRFIVTMLFIINIIMLVAAVIPHHHHPNGMICICLLYTSDAADE